MKAGPVRMVVISVLTLASLAHASSEVLLVVSQPMIEADSGEPIVGSMTYQAWTSIPAGLAGSYTCGPAMLATSGGSFDRNAARELGIRLDVDLDRTGGARLRRDSSGVPFEDTLKATLDLSDAESKLRQSATKRRQEFVRVRSASGMDTTGLANHLARSAHWGRAQLAGVLDVTIRCMIENAVRSSVRIRHLRIDVVGSPELSTRAGVYAVPDSFVVRRRR